jgi:cytochrome P450
VVIGVTTVAAPPTVPFEDPSVLEFSPLYGQLREAEPISRVRTPTGDPAWLVTRYDDVKALLSDERLGRSHPSPLTAPRYVAGAIAGGPLMDPATEKNDHGNVRRVMSRPFGGRRMRSLQPLVESVVQELVDDIIHSGQPVDLHERFSLPLPERVLVRMLGVPDEDRRLFWQPVQDSLVMDDAGTALAALGDLTCYAQQLIERKRRHPDGSLLAEIIAMADEQGLISDALLTLTVDALLIAGQTTMTGRLDLAIVLMLQHPEQFAMLVRDPALVPGAAEEALRLTQPPRDVPLRYAKEDIDCHGVTIRAGELVLLLLATANRDPRIFTDPDHFDITRSPNPHLTFGYGPASCVGAALARLEMQAAFEILLRGLPTLRLAVPFETLELRRDVLGGGLVTLPVTW